MELIQVSKNCAKIYSKKRNRIRFREFGIRDGYINCSNRKFSYIFVFDIRYLKCSYNKNLKFVNCILCPNLNKIICNNTSVEYIILPKSLEFADLRYNKNLIKIYCAKSAKILCGDISIVDRSEKIYSNKKTEKHYYPYPQTNFCEFYGKNISIFSNIDQITKDNYGLSLIKCLRVF